MSGALANLAQRLGLRVSLRPLQQAALQPPCFTQQQAGYSSGSLDQHQDEVRTSAATACRRCLLHGFAPAHTDAVCLIY